MSERHLHVVPDDAARARADHARHIARRELEQQGVIEPRRPDASPPASKQRRERADYWRGRGF